MIANAKWIGIITDNAIGGGTKQMEHGAPAAYFRKQFKIDKPVLSAQLIASAQGIYQPYINGKATDQGLFKPQWSDYHKHLNYQTFDVTSLITQGENCVGAVVGDGWYSGKISIIGRQLYGTYPLKLYMFLQVQFTDGTQLTISSNKDFLAGTGKIRDNDFQNGETHDNTMPHHGVFMAGYCDNSFISPTEFTQNMPQINNSQAGAILFDQGFAPPITYHEQFNANFLHIDKCGRYIYDISQNISGNICATFTASLNDKIVIRYGEMLQADGSLYTENLRSAKCTDTVICRQGENSFEPLFTFHGFRYIEITMPQSATINMIVAKACYSDIAVSGSFSSDNALINKIYKNAFWSQKDNFVGLPTDCPQRDERMGWTGDTFAFCGSAMYNMDCKVFYKKYLLDLFDAQRDDGAVTDVVPFVPIVSWGNNGWGDVISELPYLYYCMYGDIEFLKQCVPNVKKWVQYLLKNSDNYVRPFGGFGDWLSIIINEADVMAMNTAFFAHSCNRLSQMCKIINDPDSAKYDDLFNKVKATYIKTFVKADTTVANGAQGDYLFAGAFNLIDMQTAGDKLASAVVKANRSLSCGFMSVKYLLPILCQTGYSNLAYELIAKDTYPSWGYSVKQGATTIWEHWDSWTAEKGFSNPEMNSFNHYSLGACTEWYYSHVLGICHTQDSPAFSKTIICPYPDFGGHCNSAEGKYKSENGTISVSWSIKNDICDYTAKSDGNALLVPNFGGREILDIQSSDKLIKVKFKQGKNKKI